MQQQFKHSSIVGNVPYSTGHMVGTAVEVWSDRQDFSLGTEQDGSNGATVRYVTAGVALPAGPCTVNAVNVAAVGTGYKIIRPAKVGQFGWVVKERT